MLGSFDLEPLRIPRAKLFPLPNRGSPRKRRIVFMLDMADPLGKPYRVTFCVPEAVEQEK